MRLGDAEKLVLMNESILILHTGANFAVSPLPEHAVLLLHVALLDVVVRAKISIWMI